jgi:hypothetical protein
MIYGSENEGDGVEPGAWISLKGGGHRLKIVGLLAAHPTRLSNWRQSWVWGLDRSPPAAWRKPVWSRRTDGLYIIIRAGCPAVMAQRLL